MDAIRYYVKGADNGTYGPVDLAALSQWVAENRLAGNTLIQIEGSQRWQLASTIPEIAALLPGYTAPATSEPNATDTSIPLATTAPGIAGVPLPTPTTRTALAYSSLDQVTNALAFGSMLCGILSLIGCNPIAGTVAIVCGHMGRKQIRQRPERFTGDGMALAGMILGYISAGLFVAFFVFYIVMIIFVVAAGAARP
ncbi:MAG: DUF4190 domain-containing protein [Phycisphaerae bacterium]